MAQDTSLNGLRNQILTSIFGRRLGLDSNGFILGPNDFRTQVEGVSSAGSTIVSTAVATSLSNYGISLVGATAASATTAYVLSAPQPGVYKTIFCPTSGYAVIVTSGANICSTGNAGSTQTTITFAGKGNSVQLIGLTTALWGVIGGPTFSSVTTGQVSFV